MQEGECKFLRKQRERDKRSGHLAARAFACCRSVPLHASNKNPPVTCPSAMRLLQLFLTAFNKALNSSLSIFNSVDIQSPVTFVLSPARSRLLSLFPTRSSNSDNPPCSPTTTIPPVFISVCLHKRRLPLLWPQPTLSSSQLLRAQPSLPPLSKSRPHQQ